MRITIEIGSFLSSITALLWWAIIPSINQLRAGRVPTGISEPKYFQDSFNFLIYQTVFFIIIVLTYFLLERKSYSKKLNNLLIEISKSKTSNNLFPNKLIFLLIYILGSALLIKGIAIENILETKSRYSASNPILYSIGSLIMLYTQWILLLIPKRNPTENILLFFNLLLNILYPVVIASRSIVIPFVIWLITSFDKKNNLYPPILNIPLIALFTTASLITRSKLGIDNFFKNIYFLLSDPFQIFEINSKLLPGLTTTSVAFVIFNDVPTYGLSNFLLNISPLPSFLLPESANKVSFSALYEINNVGINGDIFSEWIFWFGKNGWIAGSIFFALIIIIPFELIKRGIIKTIAERRLLQLTTIFYFFAGYIMPSRAASRYFLYSLIYIFIVYFYRKYFIFKNTKINL